MTKYKYIYETKEEFSDIIMYSDGIFLTGLYFKDFNKENTFCEIKELKIFKETHKWLDIYFNGINPSFTLKYKLENITAFQKEVYDIISNVDYGETVTYNDIAKIIAKKKNIKRMSAQAVGKALKHNPICIIIPCHRVIKANNELGGYSGGVINKRNLLKLEGINIKNNTN